MHGFRTTPGPQEQRANPTTHKRGNPNWGKAQVRPDPVLPTEFEVLAKSLGLREKNYANSEELRSWCQHNKNRCYIPEWLLKKWDLAVDVSY